MKRVRQIALRMGHEWAEVISGDATLRRAWDACGMAEAEELLKQNADLFECDGECGCCSYGCPGMGITSPWYGGHPDDAHELDVPIPPRIKDRWATLPMHVSGRCRVSWWMEPDESVVVVQVNRPHGVAVTGRLYSEAMQQYLGKPEAEWSVSSIAEWRHIVMACDLGASLELDEHVRRQATAALAIRQEEHEVWTSESVRLIVDAVAADCEEMSRHAMQYHNLRTAVKSGLVRRWDVEIQARDVIEQLRRAARRKLGLSEMST